MVYILVTAIYPPSKGVEIAKVWLSGKQPKYPDFIKRVHQFVTADFKAKSYALYECEDDKIVEGMKAIGARYVHYASIEGYEYKVELLMEAKDAMKLVGL